MSSVENALFISGHDIRYQLRQGATLLWLFVMPPIFFFFIGTVTGGFSSGVSGGPATPLTVVAASPGFLQPQIDMRLRENDFAPQWQDIAFATEDSEQPPARSLTFPDLLSDRLIAGEQVIGNFETSASSLRRDFEKIRIQRSLYTVLADVAVADATSPATLTAADLEALNAEPRIWGLQVEPAGKRQKIPTGFDQAVPGIMVMFTLLVLLTSGASMLAIERRQGLLRRLASAPISRHEIVAGKWGGRMALAVVQVGFAMVVGTLLFGMRWGPDLAMVLAVLFGWAAFCASAGLLLGSIARTEGQAVGLGVLAANLLAALGGCWWPIEITPDWMQSLQNLLPTGWAMDGLHKLISFEAGAASAVPQLAALLLGTVVLLGVAVQRFRYD
ncbi:MAG TPA: ABC transporter permease [Woeseiaceae bacterium]|nr:ABC transporter permease [Woeseiaceae bacterium]